MRLQHAVCTSPILARRGLMVGLLRSDFYYPWQSFSSANFPEFHNKS
jgi:hypothetical protein